MRGSHRLRTLRKAALCLGLLSPAATAVGYTLIPAEYERLNHPAPEMTVINPYFSIKGEKIRAAKLSLDGAWLEHECSSEDRNSDGKTCGKPFELAPGPHILEVVLCTDPHCLAFGKAWRNAIRFAVAPRERLTLDLEKLGELREADEGQAIARKRAAGKISACGAAIEQAFYVNTCRAAGVKAFGEKMDAMQRICGATWSKDTDLLLALALWSTSNLDPRQCYKGEEVKKLPAFLTRGVDADFWPQGTVEGGSSSWRWARAVDEDASFSKLSGERYRKAARKAVATWAARQVVVDQLVDAHLDPAKHLGPLLAAARSGSWDVNPTTPAGHRNFALAASEKLIGQPGVTEAIAAGSAQNEKIHCGYRPEVDHIMRAFLRDEELTAQEWAAVSGFVARTPASYGFDACKGAFGSKVKGDSNLSRLRVLARADCAKARAELRGTTIRALVSPSLLVVTEADKAAIRNEFKDCVPPDTTVADRWKRIDEEITRKAKELEAACGRHVTVTVDKASFKGRQTNEAGGDACVYGIDRLRSFCGVSKTEAAKVRALSCRAGEGERSVFTDFQSGTLVFTVGKDRGFSAGTSDAFLTKTFKGIGVQLDGGGPAESGQDWAEIEAFLQGNIKNLMEDCGKHLTVKIDAKSFAGRPKEWGTPAACASGIDLVRNSCGYEYDVWVGESGEGAASKMKQIVCRGSSAPEAHFSAFQDGVLFFDVGKSSSYSQAASATDKKYLAQLAARLKGVGKAPKAQ